MIILFNNLFKYIIENDTVLFFFYIIIYEKKYISFKIKIIYEYIASAIMSLVHRHLMRIINVCPRLASLYMHLLFFYKLKIICLYIVKQILSYLIE